MNYKSVEMERIGKLAGGRARQLQRVALGVAAVFLVLSLMRARADERAACAYENLAPEACQRVATIVGHWRTPDLQAIPLAGVSEPQPAADVHPDPDLDAANARFMSRQSEIGPCRFNEAEGRVEVTPSAFALSDARLTQCLSAAYSHARYYTVEAKWLEKVGEHEAWINRNGVMVKVAVDRKLEPVAARDLWASFAGRELAREAAAETQDAPTSRTIASADTEPAASADDAPRAPKANDGEVRELLGFK